MADLRVWGRDLIEDGTVEQAERTARLPFVEALALMPDAHVGKGATIGSVVITGGELIVAAVGTDIGCGMAARRLDRSVTVDTLPDDLGPLLDRFGVAIPAGVGKGHEQAHGWLDEHPAPTALSEDLTRRAATQYGSLGSGNHFLEVSVDKTGRVWLVLHSGSRGIGHALAERHIETARTLRAAVELEDRDLAWLEPGEPEHAAYVADLLWAQDYAAANRERMLDLAWAELEGFLGRHLDHSPVVDCHHNYAAAEVHDGREVWVTRKGAISARKDEWGIIPGSMGTETHIVRGLGNPASFQSCSHGAGRRLSRGQARRSFTGDDLTERMGDRTWLAGDANALVDEIPDAYKDVGEVMIAQADLVVTEHLLEAVLNYKGLR